MFNQKLVNARLGKGWSPEEASERVGVTLRTYLRWEAGTHLPQSKIFGILLRTFGEPGKPARPEGLGFIVDKETGHIRFMTPADDLLHTEQKPKEGPGLADEKATEALDRGLLSPPGTDTIVIQTSYVQIFLDETASGRTTPSVVDTSPYFLGTTIKNGASFSPSDSQIEGIIIPMVGVSVKGESNTDPLRRKIGGFIKQTAQAGLASVFAPEFLGRTDLLQRLERAVIRPSLIDTTLLSELRSSVTDCWKLLPEIVEVVSSEHLTVVHTHLTHLIELLEAPLSPSVRKSLTSLAAECSLIAGIMYNNRLLPTIAERYFTAACTAAEEADNQALKAVIHGRMSMLPGHSLVIIQEVLPWAKKHGTGTTYSWLQARCAEVYAEHLSTDAQYSTACEKAMEQATTFSAKGDPEHDPYWTCFDECLMYGYQGACSIKLRKPEAAKTGILRALQLSNPQNLFHQTDLQTDLARVYQLQGDVVNACLCGHRALLLISRTHSLGHLQGLEDFRSNFAPGQTDTALQAFDEHKRSVEELLR